MSENPHAPTERRLRAALARSSRARPRGEPGAADRLCEETAARLLEHLDPVRLEPVWVVDIVMQCALRDRLAERFPGARVLSCGYRPGAISPGGAEGPGEIPHVVASPLRLPIADGSADLVVSNLALSWYSDAGPFLREAWRVLRPGGLAAFATFGPETLAELRQGWNTVDDYSHIIDFIDMHDIGDAMLHVGFGDVVMDAERITVTWPAFGALLEDLRGLGTGNPLPGRPSGLTTTRKLAALENAYPARLPGGRVPATVELVHGHGWKPQGRAEVPFDSLTAPG